MDKSEVVDILRRIARMLELLGENKFKHLAYEKAARTLDSAPERLADLVAAGRLGGLPGIGKALEEKITLCVTTGRLPYYDELSAQIPEGVLEIMDVPGVGAKKARVVWQELGITSLGELEYACRENRLTHLSGFGEKTQMKVLAGIEFLRMHAGKVLYPEAEAVAEKFAPALASHPAVKRMSVAGSLRRRKEIVKDIDLVVSTESPGEVFDHFCALPGITEATGRGETKCSVRTSAGLAVDVRAVSDAQYPFALQHFTGSKEHNTLLRALAKEQGMKSNEYGLFRGESLVLCVDEAEIYEMLGLAYIPPELREGGWEIEAARRGDLPELIEETDIAGVLHVHTHYSDGRATLEEMARAGAAAGYAYLGIADHSQSAVYAHGLSVERVHEQHEEIDRVNAMDLGCVLLKGIESDILGDGSLDYDEETLSLFDYVVASVHSRFTMSEAEQTERIVRAVQNPHTSVLGHATGRLLLARAGYPVDLDAVLRACAESGTAIEINAHPVRLDLDWRWGQRAQELGVMATINPDAHRTSELDNMRYGVHAARRGGWSRENVLNTRPMDELLAALNPRRAHDE